MSSNLPTRPLGSSGIDITPVGFGAWAIGGGGWSFGWGPQDDTASLAAMRRALELGVNWIDTAAVYGLGHSEELVGRLLRELPRDARPFVFTKGGLVWDDQNRMGEPRRVLKPESIRLQVEGSLRRLGVERIDLYQLHWPDDSGTPVEDSWEMMTRLVEEGKVRAAGVSNFDVGLLARCEAVYFVSGDVAALRAARRSRVLVATARELATLKRAEEQIDVLVGSGEDPGERFEPGELEPPPRTVVTTSGGLGGWVRPGGPFRAAPLSAPIEDAYGCGDCFAAGLTYALAGGRSMEDAVHAGARCGAAVLTGRGAYTAQLGGGDFTL